MGIQIRGLVKAFRNVRSTLQAGVTPEEVDSFRTFVEELVTQVEDICSESGLTPAHLPTPSRNAFRYLKQIDLSNLPMREEGAPLPPASQALRIPHMVKKGNQIAAHMWQRRAQLLERAERRRTLSQQIAHDCDTIERLAAQHQATPAALEKPSQQVYCWFKFLAQPHNLDAHIEALCRAGILAVPFMEAVNAELELTMLHLHSLWRVRTQGQTLRVKCTEGFLHATDDVWQAMFASIFSRDPEPQAIMSAFVESEDYSSVRYELASFIDSSSQSKGVVHDLEESFHRVNQAYFSPGLTPCRLHWSTTPITTKFGHYQSSTDAIMISSSLDHTEVPAFVIDFVMYHEMLHKLHGFAFVDGRRMAHTHAFREDERKFASYQAAEEFLLTWGEGL